MQDTGLGDGLPPRGLDRVGQARQAVADHDAHVLGAAVLDLGQHLQPVLGALTTGADPHPQHIALTGEVDPDRDVDRPVGHLPVADLHVDRVDEDHRIDGVEGPVLPFGHAVHDLVGDGGDRLPGDFGAVDLGQVGLDLTGRQALRGQ